jgi:arylsulfatase A-like enzyme
MIPEIRANYYGKISLIDDQVGRIVAALDRRGWLDRTLIVFLADHGEMLGDHGRFRKGTFHESSIRIPLLMRWPEKIVAGAVSAALVENVDVFPTIAEAAGGEPSPARAGRSLWTVLRQPEANVRDTQLCEVRYNEENQTMVRTRHAKLALDAEDRFFMLYDLKRDPQEQCNLVGSLATRSMASDLQASLKTHVERSRFRTATPCLPTPRSGDEE